ncbi:tetratricopeptide repeat protein [Streptomyces sp. NBC_00287]|uniref:ATP-binding protein n=1 Tax=Streptomyces sp. NBC_00287 TaxID=2975702 RepID=UPI002E2A1531|nr:tetratricopeptide repeat protein [Streptomyces sp. NBC_00287]
MSDEYGEDHLDFRGGAFKGPVVGKGNFYQQAAAPTALSALPARAAGFTGRGDELGELLRSLDPAGEGEAVLVAAVSGLGGIGKTALAVEAAHEACGKGWFPGGVLFLDLHGYDDDPVTGEQALEALLRALGVEPEHIPVRADERAALYRSMLAERGAVLVLADNASSSDQVRRLLPGDRRQRLLVTSRTKLPQLGARLLPLGELSPQEAYDLLDRALRVADPADSRAAQEAEAVQEVAERCGHLPLALQIAAALLVLDPEKPVAELAEELGGLRDRLAYLDDGERSVRAAFELSYRRLTEEQARLLRLMAVAPGADVSTEMAAVLVGTESPPVREFNALAHAHLIERGSARGRWGMHDLVRAFGVGLAGEEGEAARERLLEFYRQWAEAADDWLRWLPGMPEPERFVDRAQALAWLDGERAGLVAAVQWASEDRHTRAAVWLARCLAEYMLWRRYFGDWMTVARAAQEAAHRSGDRDAEAGAWGDLGNALVGLGRTGEAVDAHIRARDLGRLEGSQLGEAVAWNNLGLALDEAGRTEEAIDAHIRARDLCQLAEDRHGEAMAWNNLGLALGEAGRTEEAIDAHIRARGLYQDLGDIHREGTAWNNLGLALRKEGQVEEAIEAHEKALGIYETIEAWYLAGTAFQNLAVAHRTSDRPAEAHACFVQAADAYTQANALTEAAHARAQADAFTP